jgi:hypothetical protein
MKTNFTGIFWRTIAYMPITGWFFWRHIEKLAKKELGSDSKAEL